MLWLVPFAHAADPTVGGTITPQVVVDVPAPEDQDYAAEDKLSVDTWARVFAHGELPSSDTWFLEARLQHHILYGPHQAGPTVVGDVVVSPGVATEGWWEASLGDSGWDGEVAGPVRARVGVLTERWGTLELLPISDVLNPRDARSGPLIPAEFLKQPIPMGVISVGNDTVSAETVLIPLSSADKLWIRDQDWSFVRQEMIDKELYAANDWGWGATNDTLLSNIAVNVKQTPVSSRRLSDAGLNGRNLPEAFVANGEIAERVRLHARNVDLDLMGGYLRSRQPETEIAPILRDILKNHTEYGVNQLTNRLKDTGPVEVTWPRTAVVGLDGATLVGPIQVRVDSMYQSARPIRAFWGAGQSVPQLAAGIGFDYVRGSSFFATIESRWQHLVGTEGNPLPAHMLLTREDQVQIAGGVRLGLARGALTIQLGGMYDPTFSEYLTRPSVGFRFTDHFQADLGVLLLGGATSPPKTLEDVLTYEGGPASFFSQNDEIVFSVSLIR